MFGIEGITVTSKLEQLLYILFFPLGIFMGITCAPLKYVINWAHKDWAGIGNLFPLFFYELYTKDKKIYIYILILYFSRINLHPFFHFILTIQDQVSY